MDLPTESRRLIFPPAQSEVMEIAWQDLDKADSLWTHVEPVYVPRHNWRVLLSGKDLR